MYWYTKVRKYKKAVCEDESYFIQIIYTHMGMERVGGGKKEE